MRINEVGDFRFPMILGPLLSPFESEKIKEWISKRGDAVRSYLQKGEVYGQLWRNFGKILY
jgi:hypothetical protein